MAKTYLNTPVPTPTQNPVPSADIRDHVFGGAKLDEFVTSFALQYIDRFGKGHYTIEGLKQLVLQQIYNLGWSLAGSFQGGGTVTSAGELLQDESTNIWYRWDDLDTLPRTVLPGSTPASAGGTGEGKWQPVDVADVLRKDLAKPTGAALIGVAPGRTQADKNADVICVLDKGAKADSTTGLDGTDSTSAFLATVAECLATGKAMSIPKALNGYRLTQTIDLRGVNVMDNDATIYINHSGIGIIFGGNSSNPNNPSQSFGTITRVTGTAGLANPDMRGIGVKGQNIYVERCDYLQLYADDAPAVKLTDYSCGYSTLTLKKVDTIQIYGMNTGWINENIFYLNRTNKILFVDGAYQHNHNHFHHGTMEGAGIIDMPVGSSNYLHGFRFERVGSNPSETLNINFGAETWNNIIEATWKSTPGYGNEPYNPNNLVTVNDLGRGNAVFHAQDEYADEVTVFALSEATPFVSSLNAGLTGAFSFNTDLHGVRFVQHLVDGRFKCLGNFGRLLMDDRKIPVRNGDMFMVYSDVALFRPVIYLYDMAGKLIQTEPSDPNALTMPGKNWASDGYYSLSSNSRQMFIGIGSGISAVRMQMNFGTATVGQLFKYLRITARFYKESTSGNRKAFGVVPVLKKSAMSYFNASDINMANIAEGIPCYKNDMTEMKINLIRQRYLVKSVAGNVITVAEASVQYFDQATSAYVAYTSGTDNLTAQVSAVSGLTITLTGPVPADIVAGSPIDFIITKTKALS